ncbi:MAG: hypothetical protein M3539_00975, partial [Acidobacteriota bacterium]|nr:hypothetical protein [Acidobacteriota bacterium]
MKLKRRGFLGGFNRFRLMLTLGLAVVLPAAALIYVNYSQLRGFERDKVLEAAIHRDFQERLALTEKTINKKALTIIEDARNLFPSPDTDPHEKEKRLDLILAKSPWLSHVFLFDEKSFIFHSQPELMKDRYTLKEHEKMVESYRGWFGMEGKSLVQGMHKKTRPMNFYSGVIKQRDGEAYVTTALFVLPQLSKDRVVFGGATFDASYLKQTFFPGMLQESVNEKMTDQGGYPLAMMVYRADMDMGQDVKPLAASTGWGEGKPEVSRKLDDVFRGLALGIKFQGTSVKALGQTWVHRSLIILGFLSLLIIGGLVLTKHIVSKEMALARLKSDFVSNVSHELRTPLALIRLYAETLELG